MNRPHFQDNIAPSGDIASPHARVENTRSKSSELLIPVVTLHLQDHQSNERNIIPSNRMHWWLCDSLYYPDREIYQLIPGTRYLPENVIISHFGFTFKVPLSRCFTSLRRMNADGLGVYKKSEGRSPNLTEWFAARVVSALYLCRRHSRPV